MSHLCLSGKDNWHGEKKNITLHFTIHEGEQPKGEPRAAQCALQ